MNKKIFAALFAFSFVVCAIYAQEVKYISPNDDGVKDVLSFPLRVYDKRYVASWHLVIMDKAGKTVRTIGNKESLPSHITFKNIIKHIKDAKKDADVPVEAVWNGRMDNGETAPDGEYTYYVTAADDNGNTSKTAAYTVVVDNTPPAVTVLIDGISAASGNACVFGAGDKAVINITQKGSSEDEWVAKITDDGGRAVRHYSWKGEPKSFEWNGTDDSGLPVPDGVYSYSIEATDRAGNRSQRAGISNIVFSADKAVTAIAIKGSRYFSPGTNSKQKTIAFDVTIPVPNKNSGNKLSSWEVSIIDGGGKVRRTWQGTGKSGEEPVSSLVYDGTGDSGEVLPDGKYTARVMAAYLNGYEPPAVYSPVFVLDTSKPSAEVSVSESIFGAGEKSTVTIASKVQDKPLAAVREWRGAIEDAASGRAVREYEWSGEPQEIVWDGMAKDGAAPDGKYVLRLYAVDEAGNYGEAVSEPFVLDTSEAIASISAMRKAFSPIGSNPVMDFRASSKAGESGGAKYKFAVTDALGRTVYSLEGVGEVPARFTWDGKNADGIIAPDGEYAARLDVEGANTSKAQAVSMPFMADSTPPYLKANVLVQAFAPSLGMDALEKEMAAELPSANKTAGVQKTAPVQITDCTTETLWTADINDDSGKTIKRIRWSGTAKSFDWDGTDESGNIAPDGDYKITLFATDDADNSFSLTLPAVTLDTRDAAGYITAEHEGISPNGDGYLDTQKFDIALSVNDSIVSWQADVCDERGQAVHSWMGGIAGKENETVPKSIEWDGFVAGGAARRIAGEGTFNMVLRAAYKTGRTLIISSRPFVCTATPPRLSVAIAPEYFSPDNDGTDDDLFLTLGCITKARVKSWTFNVYNPGTALDGSVAPAKSKVFWQVSGKGDVTKRLIWDGLSNTQRDSNGMAERVQSAVDYPYEFAVADDLGMKSMARGVIPVDVLVIREGNVLKMAVPSIIFRADHADFKVETKPGKRDGVTAWQARNNEKVLSRVADILGKFKDYKVTVAGHANRTNEDDAEETTSNMKVWGPALIPLSQARADAVKDYLIKHGVNKSRLTAEGLGGTQPVTDWHDKDNNWKNRRVEFILHK